MPVMGPAAGLSGSVPAGPIGSGRMAPGRDAAADATNNPVDIVSLSPAARQFQALDAPVVTMRQLGALLSEFEQIDQLTSNCAPLVLGGLAAEIGSTAEDLGSDLQAIAPWQDGPALPAQASIALLRALDTLGRGASAVTPPGMAPLAGDTGPGLAGAGPSGAAASPYQHDPAAAAPGGGRNAGLDGSGTPDPRLQAEQVAGLILQRAAGTLRRMQARLHAEPAYLDGRSAAVDADTAWCEMQIELACAQVARATHPTDASPGRGPVRIDTLLGWQGVSKRVPGLPAAAIVLLAAGVLALTGQADLATARLAVAAALAVAGLAWAWRSGPWRQARLRVELTH